MAIVTRNALKGYCFQNYVFTLLLAKMDTEKNIIKIEAESSTPGQFDDIYIEDHSNSYRIQVKNYPNTTLDDIKISGNTLIIKSNKNTFCASDNNILIVNTSKIKTNTSFMGFDAINYNGITVVPLTENDIERFLDKIFKSITRELQIIQLVQKFISSSKFVVEANDLPPLIRISTDLENKTILLRDTPAIDNGITFVEGQPGVGKSHYVNEIKSKNINAIIYRFWTSSQDDNLKQRLMFQTFIEDLGLAVFNSSKNFELKELIDEINTKQFTILIDGLDHVENYNPTEMEKYFNFINALSSSKIVVFSRPLKTKPNWKTIVLGNWNFDELYLYLTSAYEITDYNVARSIFTISDGYPIITHYLAEHYKLTGEINFDCKLHTLNQYYDALLSDVFIKTPLTLFATNNSFFILDELDELLDNKEMSQMVNEFISCYPYLFKQTLNRYSLMHDSFNTYLRKQLEYYNIRRKVVSEKVKSSLFAGEIRYMSRLTSFDFEEDFFDELLQKYSDFNTLRVLLKKTLDYNSITDFYNQLQLILEKRPSVLSVYQLYSFALIHQCVNRNDMIGFDEVVFQVLVYMKRYGNIEDQIFSSGVMWNLFVMLKTGNDLEYKRYLSNNHYSQETIYDIYEKIDNSQKFFEQKTTQIEVHGCFQDLLTSATSSLEKRNIIIDYLLSVWINNEQGPYMNIVNKFLYENEITAINELVELTQPYNIEKMWISSSLNAVRYKLHELGYFNENNMFRNITLENFILSHSEEGSFQIMQYMESFLRLLNFEKREIDIYSINMAWIMYYMRKDYSVYNLDLALIQFEQLQLITSAESLKIIKKTMNQSEKGIRLLMTSYINNKSVDFITELINKGFFTNNSQISFFDLSSKHIDCFDDKFVRSMIIRLLNYHHTKTIEYIDVKNIISSKYNEMFFNYLIYNNYTIFNVYDENAIQLFESKGIHCLKAKEEIKGQYVPFSHGCIHEEDKPHIIENQLPHTKICCYTDGWFNSFPYIDLYLLYDQDSIRKDYLKIIHTAMFARTSSIQHIGNWSLLLGNIPLFLNQSEVDVDWNTLYDCFKQFLEISLITC